MAIPQDLSADLNSNMNLDRVFQKHVIDGTSYFFREQLKTPDEEYRLRHEIAKLCSTSLHDVIIIGSAKLGFSVKTNDFPAFDARYQNSKKIRDRSDIDIAIVNRSFFDSITREIFEISEHFNKEWIAKNWKYNSYYTDPNADLFENYTRYIAKGWARPDYMPSSYNEKLDLKNLCKAWKNRLERKISVGIYSDWYYLKAYHTDHLAKLRSKLQVSPK